MCRLGNPLCLSRKLVCLCGCLHFHLGWRVVFSREPQRTSWSDVSKYFWNRGGSQLNRRKRWLTPYPCKLTNTEDVWCAKDETKAIHISMSLVFKLRTDSNSLLFSSQSSSLFSPVQKIPIANIWEVYCSKAERWGEPCLNAAFFWQPMERGSKTETVGSLLATDRRILDPGTMQSTPGKSGVKPCVFSVNEFKNA